MICIRELTPRAIRVLLHVKDLRHPLQKLISNKPSIYKRRLEPYVPGVELDHRRGIANAKMLRHFAILCIVASCFSAISLVQAKVADIEFLKQQKIVYDLCFHVDQPEVVPDLYNVGKEYSIENNLGSYEHEHYVKEFLRIYEKGMLPRGEIFSVFYSELLDQAVALFRIFYYAKDFDTLYKTAAWAKIYVNEGIFTYAFSVAVVHHPLTSHIRIPAYHELYPHIFFDSQVLRKVYDVKSYTDPKTASSEDPIIVYGNSSNFYPQEEDVLDYFTGSVETTDLLYYCHIFNPFWMPNDGTGFNLVNRGVAYLWITKLQYIRYYLERLSHDMNEIEDFDLSYPIPYEYRPRFSYHNGLQLPSREEYAVIPNYNYKFVQALRDYDLRITTAIDMGNIILNNGTFAPARTPEGETILGSILEGNADSINFDVYGSYDRVAKKVLGFSPEPIGKYKVLPSILQHFGADQKDPMYWSLMKRISSYYDQFLSYLPKYTYDQLALPGVKIESVDVDEITTFFTSKDYLVSGAVKVQGSDDKTVIKIRQNRLNHKLFTYNITVKSEKDVKATVRMFLGPWYSANNEEMDITQDYKHFWPLDMWNVDLKQGSNVLTRSNLDNIISKPDEPSGDLFYAKILRAIEGKETYDIPRKLYAYPESMIIPIGKTEGYPYQFLFFVGPYTGEKYYENDYKEPDERDVLVVPSLYPLDRPVSSNFTELPNVFFKKIDVFHVEKSDINATS